MRLLGFIATIALLSACERVDFEKRKGLSLTDRALAVQTLRVNNAAINAGDMALFERTFHDIAPNLEAIIETTRFSIEKHAPKVSISDVATVYESPNQIILEFTRNVQSNDTKPGGATVRMRATLLRSGDGWGIAVMGPIGTVR
ncbi:MAG: hypothetical protein RL088_228 [Verrucomicrobiota bacterium]|jgi:hypothetical protein